MKENESTDAHMHTCTHAHTPGMRAGKGMGGVGRVGRAHLGSDSRQIFLIVLVFHIRRREVQPVVRPEILEIIIVGEAVL